MWIRFLIYGAIGCLMEVFWTGLGSLIRKDFQLKSYTSIWMFFIYGLAVFIEPLIIRLAPYHFMWRGFVYMLCIFAIEYVTGRYLKYMKLCPWDYSGSKFAIAGVIRLDYAPAWMAAGLIFERVYFFIV